MAQHGPYPISICVARNVYNQVKAKLGLGYTPMGEHRVKILGSLPASRASPEQRAIAHQLDAAAAVIGDQRLDELLAQRFQVRDRASLVVRGAKLQLLASDPSLW